jgi:hypothetical protein
MEDGREVTQGGKFRKAKQKGTPTLTENEFQQMVRDKSGNQDFKLSSRESILKQLTTQGSTQEAPKLKKSQTVDDGGNMI